MPAMGSMAQRQESHSVKGSRVSLRDGASQVRQRGGQGHTQLAYDDRAPQLCRAGAGGGRPHQIIMKRLVWRV